MEAINLRAHYDGNQICLDEPFELEPNAQLIVTVLSAQDEGERDGWFMASKNGLASAYGGEEPDYSPEMIKEPNREYETG